MSKYEPLETHLRDSGQESVPMTFDEIERIIGAKLPPSASRHRPWWSNNPSNSVITHAWLRAGYRTANVDMAGRKLVFRRSAPDAPPPVTRDEPAPEGGAASGARRPSLLSGMFGALAGTVTFAPGTDPTAPTGEDWDAAR